MIPRLWDMGIDLVHFKSRQWNWDCLASKLSQVQIHKPADTSLALPLALRNCGVWRFLEEIRVLDDAGSEARASTDREEEQKKR
jgi:hypothetical protein